MFLIFIEETPPFSKQYSLIDPCNGYLANFRHKIIAKYSYVGKISDRLLAVIIQIIIIIINKEYVRN